MALRSFVKIFLPVLSTAHQSVHMIKVAITQCVVDPTVVLLQGFLFYDV